MIGRRKGSNPGIRTTTLIEHILPAVLDSQFPGNSPDRSSHPHNVAPLRSLKMSPHNSQGLGWVYWTSVRDCR